MIRCPNRINFRLTSTQFHQYGMMINNLLGVHNWTDLCVKALTELARSYSGPWSSPIEALAYAEQTRIAGEGRPSCSLPPTGKPTTARPSDGKRLSPAAAKVKKVLKKGRLGKKKLLASRNGTK